MEKHAVEEHRDAHRIARSEDAYRRLAAMIMDGSLAPGTPLRLAHLARELGMSPTPIREALQQLTGENLVVRLPMRGFIVSEPLSRTELAALAHARLVLEPELAALAADRASAAQLAELGRVVEATVRTAAGAAYAEYRGYLELSARFHELVAEAAGNRYLASAYATLPVHAQRFRLFGADGVTDEEDSEAEHRRVYEAMAARDPAAAREAMTAHVRGVAARI